MRIQFDTKDWKTWPKYAAAVLALLGFTNFADMVRWVRSLLHAGPSSVEEESRQRRAGDSAILARVQEISLRDSTHLTRIEDGLNRVYGLVVQIPEVDRHLRENERLDSMQREEARQRRRRLFGGQSPRGAWTGEMELR